MCCIVDTSRLTFVKMKPLKINRGSNLNSIEFWVHESHLRVKYESCQYCGVIRVIIWLLKLNGDEMQKLRYPIGC